MSVWHGDQHKHKDSGGRKIHNRKKRRYEKGFFPAETSLGKNKSKTIRKHGGNEKVRLLSVNQANISDASGKTTKVEILRVIDSLQLTAYHSVATPVNWNQGNEVVILPTISDEEAHQKFPKGFVQVKPYLRLTPQPNL